MNLIRLRWSYLAFDTNLDDEDLAIKLLCSLPKEYKHFRETFLYGKDVLTLKDVKGALLQRELIENQLTKSDKYSHDGEGLVGKGRPYGKGSSKSWGKNVI